MKVLVIGACGHIGSYLVPKLIDDGCEVVAVSRRGNKYSYSASLPEWKAVQEVISDRDSLCLNHALLLGFKPDVVVDALSFTAEDAKLLCEPLIGTGIRIIQIGSNWVFGYKITVPITEEHARTEPSGYGKGKVDIEKYLMDLTTAGKLQCTVLHPGHITGGGWYPVNPQGNFDGSLYQKIIDGNEIMLPFDGMGTLQHVHSKDVARLISMCISNPQKTVGEAFLATAPEAMTLRGYAELLFEYFGNKPKIRYLDWEDFEKEVGGPHSKDSAEHIKHSPVCSMEKAEKVLGFTPEYHALDAVVDALKWQIEKGNLIIRHH
jgi:nucleoside-diphosphate-sugar epimerase